MFDSIEATANELEAHDYLADLDLATSIFLALRMEKPLFLEGEPGVGKTEVAKVLAAALDTTLIRLQCYEGLDLSQAVYEWNYPRQLLELQAQTNVASGEAASAEDLFREELLLRRPLLQAIDASHERSPVLLIDELDRADEEFESFLLELLSDFQVTIPELGTLRARHRPVVIVTSNRTREIHDALKRRCVYCWIAYPDFDRELRIVRRKLPGLARELSRQVVAFVQATRQEELFKLPGVAETLDWAEALTHLEADSLDAEAVGSTLGFLLKYQEDVDRMRASLREGLLERVLAER